ncbi:MAG: hypothetical protein AMJ55_00755 [Gammaproteobacteria bacterium SG8_15]|nr:MAG: hypothetical protein AMJ55_00755 [Gammaproteobacteria bacterium SG8_15]
MKIIKLTLTAAVLLFSVGCGDKIEDSKQIYKIIFETLEFPGKLVYLKSTVVSPDSKIMRKEDLEYFQSFNFTGYSEIHAEAYFEYLKTVFISEEEIKAIFKDSCEQSWETFHSKYPDAGTLFGVSHVGFADNGRLAIVYLEGMSGCLAAQGVIFNLEKIAGEWKITDHVTLWNS